MIRLLSLLLVTCASTALADLVSDVIQKISTSAMADISDVKQLVTGSAINIASHNCDAVKFLFRQNYDVVTPDLSDLTIEYYTRDVKITYKLSNVAELLPISPWFNYQHKTIIYIHGFTDDPTKTSNYDISQAFLEQGDYNMLALDASSLLDISTLYVRATTNVQYIGQILGTALANMVQNGTDPSCIHLVGHSLGAHIASFTAKTLTEMTGKRVGRITGLDPAGPCFTNVGDNLKLNFTDADFVDVMHTDAFVYGLNEQVGHVDFYPNGGSKQPECLLESCSHSRSWQLFAETVTSPQSMLATGCNSWNDFKNGNCNSSDVSYMGHSCPTNTRGRYYLQTCGSSPYGLGTAGATYSGAAGVLGTIGDAIPFI